MSENKFELLDQLVSDRSGASAMMEHMLHGQLWYVGEQTVDLEGAALMQGAPVPAVFLSQHHGLKLLPAAQRRYPCSGHEGTDCIFSRAKIRTQNLIFSPSTLLGCTQQHVAIIVQPSLLLSIGR